MYKITQNHRRSTQKRTVGKKFQQDQAVKAAKSLTLQLQKVMDMASNKIWILRYEIDFNTPLQLPLTHK